MHCIAGKDRTGIVSALTLSLLGVSDEDIAADYPLSEAAEAASWARYVAEYLPDEADRRTTSSPRRPRRCSACSSTCGRATARSSRTRSGASG